MIINLKFTLFTIGISGFGGLLIFIKSRFSFFVQMKYAEQMNPNDNKLLFDIICKAYAKKYKFIKAQKNRVSMGHTQNNKWIKPYKCYPNVLSNAFFEDETKYVYKIDSILLFMIAFSKKCKNKMILNRIANLDSNNVKHRLEKIEFFKTYKDIKNP